MYVVQTLTTGATMHECTHRYNDTHFTGAFGKQYWSYVCHLFQNGNTLIRNVLGPLNNGHNTCWKMLNTAYRDFLRSIFDARTIPGGNCAPPQQRFG